MKKYLISLTLLLFQIAVNANVTVFLTYATFHTPTNSSYIETYVSIVGNSLKFVKNSNAKYQGAITISVAFSQNGEIKNAQKYTLSSPEIVDTMVNFPNFIDQQRYTLANGTYEMEISIADKNNNTAPPFTTKVPITINFPEDKISISDIQLLESFSKSTSKSILTKNGYDLVPYVSTFFPENSNRIKFYAEIYNTKKVIGDSQKFILTYAIESYEKKMKLSDYSSFLKQTSGEVNILLSELNIESLPTGNYNLIVEVRDKENKLQAEQRCFIQRKTKPIQRNLEDLKSIDVSKTFVINYKSIDTLSEYIRCLRPISSFSEVQYSENQLKGKNLELMQQYFYNFWKSRDEKEPELRWFEYYKEVMKVNKEFGVFGLKGYDSDRGRVYLQYGAPDLRNKVENSQETIPYEIWQYNALVDKSKDFYSLANKQSNKKFVFTNPDFATNRYRLIHSDAKGEIYNSRWNDLIYKSKANNNFNNTNMGDQMNDNYKNPK